MEGELQRGLHLSKASANSPVMVADCLLEVEDENYVNFIVEYHTVEPTQLEEKTIMSKVPEIEGVVSNDQLAISTGITLAGSEWQGACCIVNPRSGVPGACVDLSTKLLRALNLSVAHLSPTQWRQLEDMLTPVTQTFLPSTDVVTRVINTGNHMPVRQLIQRTPLALRTRVELVTDILEQGVIQPSNSPWTSPSPEERWWHSFLCGWS